MSASWDVPFVFACDSACDSAFGPRRRTTQHDATTHIETNRDDETMTGLLVVCFHPPQQPWQWRSHLLPQGPQSALVCRTYMDQGRYPQSFFVSSWFFFFLSQLLRICAGLTPHFRTKPSTIDLWFLIVV